MTSQQAQWTQIGATLPGDLQAFEQKIDAQVMPLVENMHHLASQYQWQGAESIKLSRDNVDLRKRNLKLNEQYHTAMEKEIEEEKEITEMKTHQ